ncbi:hypothetical protein NX059_011927 [Plenodomus lindquistii]|nr:hypothetical protein NX059_011927 [Plenodomus lindquistii]
MVSQSIATVNRLEQLEKLGTDEYIIAAGPRGQQFYGTAGGYSTVHLPVELLCEIVAGLVKKIIWVSFGSTENSWFCAVETRDGNHAMRIGTATPLALQRYIEDLSVSKLLHDSLRVQLGDNDSYLAWSRSTWAASGIPKTLLDKLRSMSSSSRDCNDVSKGSLREGSWPLNNVQWSRVGAFYLQIQGKHTGNWNKVKTISEAWDTLWQDGRAKALNLKIQEELAYVSIDPHAQDSDAFVFFKKQQMYEIAPFIMGFSGGEIHTNLQPTAEPTDAPKKEIKDEVKANIKEDLKGEPKAEHKNGPAKSWTMQRAAQKPEEKDLGWATCKKAGRPHRNETWELVVEKGEKVKVLKDMGRNWYIVQGKKNAKGYLHGTWLIFDKSNSEVRPDSTSAYAQFEEDLVKMLVPGQLRAFFDMRTYIDTCTNVNCQILKEDENSLGICTHDLLTLLHGSGKYCKEWLKHGRNIFHPDRFAKFCHPEYVESLKPKAEQLFVLYGILMERT